MVTFSTDNYGEKLDIADCKCHTCTRRAMPLRPHTTCFRCIFSKDYPDYKPDFRLVGLKHNKTLDDFNRKGGEKLGTTGL